MIDCTQGSCAGGWWMYCFDLLIKKGAASEANYAYKANEGRCRPCDAVPAVSWGFVAKAGDATVAAMKEARANTAAGVASTRPRVPALQEGRLQREQHRRSTSAFCSWLDDHKGKHGAWLIRNSWSTGWARGLHVDRTAATASATTPAGLSRQHPLPPAHQLLQCCQHATARQGGREVMYTRRGLNDTSPKVSEETLAYASGWYHFKPRRV